MNRNKVYTVSLASIGILLILAQIISQYLLQKRNDDASLINRSGKQRMLSEKATKELLLWGQGYTQYRDSALRTINNWTYHHDYILNEDRSELVRTGSKQGALVEVDKLFQNLKSVMLSYANGDTSKQNEQQLLHSSTAYLVQMDDAVNKIQYASRGKIGIIKRFELAMYMLIGFFLLLELFFVVRPLLLHYQSHNEQLVRLNDELRAKQESLNEQNTRLEEAYQEKNELVSQLFINNLVIENSTNFIGLTDENFRITFINDAGRKMTALPEMSALKNRRILEVLDKDTATIYAREIIPLLKKGQDWQGRVHLKDLLTGKLIPVQAVFFPVIGTYGEVMAYATIQQDITEIIETETDLQMLTEELQASQEELRVQLEEQSKLNELIEENESILKLAQEISNTGSFILEERENGYAFKASSSANRIYEIPEGIYLTYKDVIDRVIDSEKALVQDHIRHAFQGKFSAFEMQAQFPSGSRKFLRCTLSPRESDGKTNQVIGALIDITHFKQVEEQLRVSEARFDFALSGSEDGIWDWDIENNAFYISERWKKMLGYGSDELEDIVDIVWTLMHPDDHAGVRLALKNHITGRDDRFNQEYRMREKSGNYKWILGRGKAIRNEAGKAIRLIGTHADITEIRAAQAELDEKRSNLRAIIENTSDLIWSVDKDKNLITFNELYRKEFFRGFQINLEPGSFAFQGYAPEDAAYWIKWTERALKGEKNSFNYSFNWPEGTAYYDVYINPIESSSGIHGATFYAKNITQRKQLELTAKKQEEALRQLYEAVTQINDPYGRFQKTIEIGCTFLEMDFGLINSIEEDAFEIQNIYPVQGEYTRGYRNDISTSYTNILMREKQIVACQDMESSAFNASEAYLKFKKRTFLGILLYVNDTLYGSLNFFKKDARNTPFSNGEISFLRSMGQWIQRDLEAIKYQSELIDAKNSAEMAARAKAEFLATMSHEIRTPLNGVLGMTSLLEFTPLNEEQQDFVNTIKLSGDSLLAIINDILDFSKIESGKMELEEHPLSIEQTIGETYDLLAAKAGEKGLELLYEVDENLSDSILGDVTRLRQILINLASNAVKFTDEGEVVITVKKSEDGAFVRFQVKDTGIGIPEEARVKLFKAFSQVDSSTTRKYGGTGLGLAICTRLIQAMDGEIGVNSVVGKGSEFYFQIPLKIASATDLQLDFSKLKEKPICVVDDNATNLKIMEHQFKRWGANPTMFLRPKAMLEALRQGYKPDLFILDYAMPDLDGFETAKAIRALHHEVPILMLSSLNMHPEVKGSPYLDDALSKPVKHTVLLQVVNRLLSAEGKLSKKVMVPETEQELIIEKNLRILLAEDNLFNQKLALTVLSRLGYHADMVSTGLEAVNILKVKDYDLILMDIQMPDMDGTEASKIIQEMKGEECPIIIAMTANAMEGDKEHYLASGMDDYISKPIDFQHLKLTLQKYEKLLKEKG